MEYALQLFSGELFFVCGRCLHGCHVLRQRDNEKIAMPSLFFSISNNFSKEEAVMINDKK